MTTNKFPISITESGAIPTPPEEIYKEVIARVAEKAPSYTANLPPALITDLASTVTAALSQLDQAKVGLINSVSPFAANIPLLRQLGAIYGVPKGVGSNTSVLVVFSGNVGFVIPKGLVVSDSNYQYVVQHNSVIAESGQSGSVYCLATTEGSWAVPVGSVNQVISSTPAGITLTCTNTQDGMPGQDAQAWEDYRAQVMQAGMFAVQGTPSAVKASLRKVTGVVQRLVAFREISAGRWAAIVGGGDPYDVGLALYNSVPDISALTVDVPDANPPPSVTVAITDSPDSYDISFITPESETVGVILTWNTSAQNFIDPTSISTLAVPALVDYLNQIPVGKPVNAYALQSVFQVAVAAALPAASISLIQVGVVINGAVVAPEPHSGLVFGDAYRYFTTDASQIKVQHFE